MNRCGTPRRARALVCLVCTVFKVYITMAMVNTVTRFNTTLESGPGDTVGSLVNLILFIMMLIISCNVNSSSPIILTSNDTCASAN